MRADEDEIDWVAWQAVSGDRISGDEPAVKNLQAHPDDVWQNDIGSEPVRKAHRQDPWKSVVRSIEDDEDDQPNGNDAQAEDEKPLEKARKQSQNSLSRLAAEWVRRRPRCTLAVRSRDSGSRTYPNGRRYLFLVVTSKIFARKLHL